MYHCKVTPNIFLTFFSHLTSNIVLQEEKGVAEDPDTNQQAITLPEETETTGDDYREAI